MRQKLQLNVERRRLLLFLFTVFSVYLFWSILLPVNAAPDEPMRFQIPYFIYQNGRLPVGYEPQILDPNWGFSYAFLPYLSGILSAVFIKIVSFFTTELAALYIAARFTSVLCSTVTAYFCYKLSKEWFPGPERWMFMGLVLFLPQFAFCSSYYNNESISVMSIAMILYCWVSGTKENWPIKRCALFAVALSICFLSYYNAYGFILCSAILFILCVAFQGDRKIHWKPLFGKGFFIVGIVAVLAGWWFVRNYLLYDGDFLGRSALNLCGEQHAIDALKPSMRQSLRDQGYSLPDMLKNTSWIEYSFKSFIAYFGWMDVWVTDWLYRAFLFLFGLAGAGLLLRCKNAVRRLKAAFASRPLQTRRQIFLHGAMLLAMGITLFLSMYYSYTSDYQPQGRYLMPLLIPLMYYVTVGLRSAFSFAARVLKRPKLEQTLSGAVFACMALALAFSIGTAVIPAYFS